MEFFTLVVRFETVLWNRVDQRLIEEGQVSMATLLALRVLGGHGGQGRVHELSAQLGITIGAASKLVDRLERDGLARRRPNPQDRRSSLIELTPVGEFALQEGMAEAEQALESLFAESEEDVRAAEGIIARLHERLEAQTLEEVRR